MNVYAYTFSNPINGFDPFGLTTWPGSSNMISSGFGSRTDPFTQRTTDHEAVDIPNGPGANVVASNSGTVVGIRQGKPGLANAVTIEHHDKSVAAYSHIKSNLKIGDKVVEGLPIGVTDLSGRSTGPHVHYEFYLPGRPVQNPTSRFEDANPYPSQVKPPQSEAPTGGALQCI